MAQSVRQSVGSRVLSQVAEDNSLHGVATRWWRRLRSAQHVGPAEFNRLRLPLDPDAWDGPICESLRRPLTTVPAHIVPYK